ncbi:hypothetical protein Vretifemale_18434, partial [Volvox reticuliferus]
SESSGRIAATSEAMRIIASLSPSPDTDGVLALPQQQLSSLGSSASPATVADLDSNSTASVLHDGEHVVRPSSIQCSTPVTTVSVLPLMGVEDGQISTEQVPRVASLQTSGGAMDLPKDGAFGPTVSHSTPFLPCVNLDEHLCPIQPEAAGVSLQEPRSPCTMAEALPASAAPATSAVTSLPTFATPCTPAVRGAPTCSEAATVGDAVPPAIIAAVTRSCNGAMVTGLRMVTEGASEVEHDDEQKDREDTSEDGWESDLAGAARICTPQSDPLAVVSTAAALQPMALSQQQFLASETDHAGALSAIHASPATFAAANLQPLARPAETPPGASASLADPEVPVLTARDRFSPPRLARDLQPYTMESLSPLAGKPAITQTISEAISSTSAAVLTQQSLPRSLDRNYNAKGGFQPMCSACDTPKSQHTPQYVEDEAIAGEPLEMGGHVQAGDPTARAGVFAAGDGEVGQGAVEAEIVELEGESRPSQVPFTAAPEQLKQVPDEEAEAVPITKKQTEQLLTKAAQLLLQAMQRASHGEPEQEAAFHVLVPILQGLAAVEGTETLELKSFGASTIEHHESATDLMATKAVSLAEAGPGINSDGTTACDLSLTLVEMPTALTQCQQVNQQNTATPVVDLQQQQQHLATTADLENFKDDVMAGVHSALMEIVDMIGSTVMQRSATAGAADRVLGTDGRDTRPSSTGPVGEGGQNPGDAEHCSVTPADPSFTPERSSSPSLAPEHQEIRITRAELEAFIFGKAVLGRCAADELLGVRLRQLYAPQLPQVHDDDQPASHGFDCQQRGPCQRSPLPSAACHEATFRGSARADQNAAHNNIEEPDLGKQNGTRRLQVANGNRTAVPRDSPLRQPLADGAKFKSLFRRSIEHLRGHLQPARSDTQHSPATADMDGRTMRGSSQYVAPTP